MADAGDVGSGVLAGRGGSGAECDGDEGGRRGEGKPSGDLLAVLVLVLVWCCWCWNMSIS